MVRFQEDGEADDGERHAESDEGRAEARGIGDVGGCKAQRQCGGYGRNGVELGLQDFVTEVLMMVGAD